jgi:hypothetical protein
MLQAALEGSDQAGIINAVYIYAVVFASEKSEYPFEKWTDRI